MSKLWDHVLGREPSKQLEMFPTNTDFEDFGIWLFDHTKELERMTEIMEKVKAGDPDYVQPEFAVRPKRRRKKS